MARLSADQVTEIAELRERGWSYGRIARKFGVSDGAIHYHCLKQGAVSPHSPGPSRQLAMPGMPAVVKCRNGIVQRRFTPDEDRRMLAMSIEGKSLPEICNTLGRARTSVKMRLMALALHEEMAA